MHALYFWVQEDIELHKESALSMLLAGFRNGYNNLVIFPWQTSLTELNFMNIYAYTVMTWTQANKIPALY